jgi:perosamine synthetase
MGRAYAALLADVAEVERQPERTDYAENIYWVYGLVLDDEVAMDAREAMRRLADHKIGTRPFFWPMHEQPVFKKMGLFAGEQHPVAERLARRGFYVPSGLALTDEQIGRVGNVVRDLFR